MPPQAGRAPEWPKKIRTLTAAELDRLTIDSAGRFYWDGKLVNYEPPTSKEPGKSPEATERSAMEMLDRAAYELGEHKTPAPIEGAELAKTHRDRDEARPVDLDVTRLDDQERAALTAAQAAHLIRTTDRVRLSLSRWQSVGAVIVVLGVAIGAAGLAAYGWATAHEWGCRIGMIKNHCPAATNNPGRSRSDIPA